jgi:hypothetical protein
VFLATAFWAAGLLGPMAHDDFGIPLEQIRARAINAAIVIGLLLAIVLFRERLRKSK